MSKGKWDNWLKKLKWAAVAEDEFKKLNGDEKLARIRHSSAHVMAAALQKIKPEAVFATGPATPTGYFYDVRTSEVLTAEDLPKIQSEMDQLAQSKIPFEVTSVTKDDALSYFEAMGQKLKLEILAKIPATEVTLYRSGEFVDLCVGPHVPHAGWCKVNKVLSLSAVHWKKEEKIPSLTRVTGTAWHQPKELKQYLQLVEEVRKRDHRVLGPQLDLFSFHEWAAGALFHPNGLNLRKELMKLWRETISDAKYVEIMNPLLYRKELFETSGHWQHFQEDIFIFRDEEHEPSFILKPMNCPDTMLFFKTRARSYRELPLRIAEGQILHRNEATGAIHGLMRTRNFVQDDAHIFVTPDQIQPEIAELIGMLDNTYKVFDLKYSIRFSTRPKDFMGEVDVWNKAEQSLQEAIKSSGRDYVIDEGEGAFYGPKIDIVIHDSLGRKWQCATIQLDFQLPERFDLQYAAEDGNLKRPIVIHRAIFGSFERFLGIIVEHFGGAFPTWLAPVQAAIMPIAEAHEEYGKKVLEDFEKAGLRVEYHPDDRINYRIRQAETRKIPYMLIMGDREAENGTVTVRRYGEKQQKVLKVEEVIAEIQGKIKKRTLDVSIKDYSSLFTSKAHVTTENEPY